MPGLQGRNSKNRLESRSVLKVEPTGLADRMAFEDRGWGQRKEDWSGLRRTPRLLAGATDRMGLPFTTMEWTVARTSMRRGIVRYARGCVSEEGS